MLKTELIDEALPRHMCWFSYLFFVWNNTMIRHRKESLQRVLETQRQNPGWIIFITQKEFLELKVDDVLQTLVMCTLNI
jgi:hypothetical protein